MDLDKIKKTVNDTTEQAKGSLNAENLSRFSLKNKVLLGGGAITALVLAFSVLSGGAPSVSLDDIKKPFPPDGSVKEQCTAVSMTDYTFWRLMKDKTESKEDIIAAYASVAETFDQSKVQSMNELEKRYWNTVRPMKRNVEKIYSQKVKEKRVNYDMYLKMIDHCIENHSKK
ncbi:hypothetical protein A9267_20260 [Shewanella sp. UCD-FRSSP16_17]|uniref:hypothetical protein n=1 Tax=Shewanella sp. UCD-FRSSP16_17 TaxID=1853256 RepID=UPI0007EEC802|nr:hypothetical protein [Shewanella sp. UCD-FRSSP16_17]OBT09912.1 hypothetical protein A9267_20260 [Shewanella sp. UCD-FRSSP16_17]